jgi:4-diphosphocytidyl-2-C-methyl-D-erythritol kinase
MANFMSTIELACYNVNRCCSFYRAWEATKRETQYAIRHTQYETMVSKEQFETIDNALLVRAPAKINLSLLIAGKRPDGFHEIETIMAKVNWYDEILIEPGQKEGVELLCKGAYWAPLAEGNLVYQAAKMLMNRCRKQADLKITLTKNIPAGSGLGSASSDAAATLLVLNKFLTLDLPVLELCKLAPKLGSDVAFFLNGPLALCQGKGEKIRKLDEIFDFLALLILPDVSVSTKKVYANYTHEPALYERLSARINGYIQENKIDLVVKICANMLEKSCFSLTKELAEIKRGIESLGIGPLCLSGSGSAMFYLIDDRDEQRAREYKHEIEEKIGCRTIIVTNNGW